jgi:hypothetical protein
MYIDGMLYEGALREGGQDDDGEIEDLDLDADPVMASDAKLRRMGLTVIDGG